jgi:C-terminal processing protease CtpA/Prc
MKRIFLLAITALFFAQCTSIKSHNEHLNDLIAEKDLKSDVDFAYKKLQNLHPNLYWYISKKDLDYKFDSLKTTITRPMTSFDFYKKLSPVVATVRQGHMFVYPSTKLLTKKETKAFTKKGIGPLSQFDFELFNDKLYVVKNKSYDKTIKIGTEVIAVNGKNPSDLIQEYNKWFTSDGFNQTLKKHFSGKRFSSFYTFENGIKDSIRYDFKYNDSIKVVSIKRKAIDTIGTNKKQIKKRLTAFEKAKKKGEDHKKSIYGYDEITKTNNRSLRFIEKDSSVAIMKIKGFTKGNFKTFYKESFSKIDYYKSKTLIIDLRDNGGGRLSEITDLYSYLSDSAFVFIDKSEVASKTSLLHTDYFKGGSVVIKMVKVIFSPLYYGYTYFSVYKSKNGKYYSSLGATTHKVSHDAFKGKVYVLINGGSFSASSIISSNLKSTKRAVFVGEETGGAYNGTVAGRMPIIKLPKSEVKVRVGLEFIAPHYKTDIEGHGIFPDVAITPTLEDRIKGNDPEMNWILEDIKNAQTPKEGILTEKTN